MKKKIIFIVVLIIIVILVKLSCCNNSSNIEVTVNDKNCEVINEYNKPLENEADNEDVVPSTGEYDQNPIEEKEVTLVFGGDILMDSFFADYINNFGVDYSWTDITDIMNSADISVVNLETCVSEQGVTKKREGYGFRSKPYTLEGLVNAGIDLVSTANNHILDYGTDAFYDTINYLDEYKIKYSGIGSNIEEAESMTVIEKNGIKVGFINYTSIIPWNDWRADEEKPGIAPLQDKDIERALQNIKICDNKCDILVAILHWGVEYESKPQENQVKLAHQIIDAGCDIIIGHHPHVLQGIEFYNDKPIFYSIGNFIFLKMNDDAGKTGIFELKINKDRFISGKIYPINIQYCKANLLLDDNPLKQEIIDKMIELSEEFNTTISADGSFQCVTH